MKEIPISKSNIFITIILAVVIVIGILILQNLPLQTKTPSYPEVQEDNFASSAGIDALKAFFTVDYQEGKDAWLNRFCALSTSTGCQFISIGSDPMWQKYLTSKTITAASITPLAKFAATDIEQVWQMKVSLSAPLPGSNKTEDIAYVAVTKTDQGWLFDRFLLEPEIKVIQARQKAYTVTAGGKKQ